MDKPLTTIQEKHKKKKLIVFDLDGTLVGSKSALDKEVAGLLGRLLETNKVAVISGGKYQLFQTNFVSKLKCPKGLLGGLFLFPTTATSFYRYQNGWKKVYAEKLTKEEKVAIKRAFALAFKEAKYVKPKKIYGKTIEDRGTQISWSALGQDVVAVLGDKGVRLKKEWRDKNTNLKLKLTKILQKHLPGLEVRAAGYTTIDITRKGIDKAYGIRQIKKHLGIDFSEMLFVGDALFPGGNDHAALKTGVECVEVKGLEDTKKLIQALL